MPTAAPTGLPQAIIAAAPQHATNEAIEREIQRVFGKNASGMLYVLTVCRENSGLNPLALHVNSDPSVIDVGVLQVATYHGVRVSKGVPYTIAQLENPATNIKVGYQIFKERGNFSAWYGCRDHNNGVYPPVY